MLNLCTEKQVIHSAVSTLDYSQFVRKPGLSCLAPEKLLSTSPRSKNS